MSHSKYLRTVLFCATSALCTSSFAQTGMTQLTDTELAAEDGQALLNLSYIAPTDPINKMNGKTIGTTAVDPIGFYKLGLEGVMELNANIKNLQLGCGGVNGNDGCDIDIKNLSISGLNNGTVASGNDAGSPTFSAGRPSTSAKLTNPFAEFAIKNPGTASTREIVGVRFSAEAIEGLLSAGLTNNSTPSTTDGIQSLSGFMQIAPTTGSVMTKAATFGKQSNEQIQGLLNALGNDRTFTSTPGHADTKGVYLPSMAANFNVPLSQVNGIRNKSAHIENVTTKIDSIPLDSLFPNGDANQLRVTFPAILVIASQAKVQLKAGSAVTNLNMNITFDQSLSMIHNIPLTGTGGYLSLEQLPMLWPGNHIDSADSTKTDLTTMSKSDVAKPGWWMSFAEPVQLGVLQATSPVDISSVFGQVATLMTTELLKEENRVYAPADSAIGSLFGITMVTPEPIVVDLNAATITNPAQISLGNIQLKNQAISANCYGSLKFC